MGHISCYHVITVMVCGGGVLEQTDLDEIKSFLRTCKEHIDNERFELVERRKCLQTLTELEMTVEDAESAILALQPSNYVKGPESDYDASEVGDIYVFGADQSSVELYIKLKCDSKRGCVCISFHRAEWPLTYPYREG